MKRICKWFFVVMMVLGSVNLPVKSFAQGPFDPKPADNPEPQGDDGIGDPCDYNGPDDPKCPIDGGLSVLLALGVGYGVKKYRSGVKTSKVDHA